MADREVALVNADGQLGTLPPDQARAAIASGGARPATPDEFAAGKALARERDLQEKFGTSVVDLNAARLAGVARGMTLGLSDQALVGGAEALGGEQAAAGMRERLSGYREANPYLSAEGEVAGVAVPTILGNPGAAAAAGDSLLARGLLGGVKALGAPTRLMGAAGEAAEAAVAGHVLGEGAGLAARLGARAAPLAARGAVEGAFIGGGGELTESALGDHELTAQKLVAGMGAGALLGGVVGGAAGIGAELASTTKRAIVEALAEGKSVPEWLESMEARKAFKAAGGNYVTEARAADRLPGGVEKIGRDIATEVPKVTGKSWVRMSAPEVADALETRRTQIGEELGALRDSFDQYSAQTGIGPSVDRFVMQAREKVVAPMLMTPGRTADAMGLERYLQDFETKTGLTPSFKLWGEFRQDFDRQLDSMWRRSDPAAQAWKDVRRLMEGEYETAAEEAANALGGSVREKHQQLKSLYQSMNFGSEMAQRALQRTGANRAFGLTDTIAAGAGLAHGGAAGATAMGLANKFVRSRGDMIMTDMFGRLARLAKVERAAAVVDGQIDKAVRGLFRPAEGAAVPAATRLFGGGKGRQRAVQETVDRIAMMQADPKVAADPSARLAALQGHAPQTATAMAVTNANVAAFLAKNLPQGYVPKGIGMLPDVKYDEAEIAKFARTLRAATDPLSVLDDMKDGTLSKEAVTAVKELYPKLYTALQQRVMQAVAEPKNRKQMTYETRIRLGTLLDLPTDGTLDPKFIDAVQATFAKQSQPPPQRAAGGGGAATVLAEQSATESDRLTQE